MKFDDVRLNHAFLDHCAARANRDAVFQLEQSWQQGEPLGRLTYFKSCLRATLTRRSFDRAPSSRPQATPCNTRHTFRSAFRRKNRNQPRPSKSRSCASANPFRCAACKRQKNAGTTGSTMWRLENGSTRRRSTSCRCY